MLRPASQRQAALGLLIALLLLTMALMAAPQTRPAAGGAFGQPGPALQTTAHQSIYGPASQP